MPIFRNHEVVVVPFPFVERAVVQPRPALVISSEAFNAEHDQVVLAMITTASRSSWPSDVQVEDLAAAGLRYPSVVRWKVFTFLADNLGQVVGRLSDRDRSLVVRRQAAVFGG